MGVEQLDGVTPSSDGFLPFRDNIDHASRVGVRCVVEPGGSSRSGDVAAACAEHGVVLVRTGLRLSSISGRDVPGDNHAARGEWRTASPLTPLGGIMSSMTEDDVHLRPVEEGDLELLERFDKEPA